MALEPHSSHQPVQPPEEETTGGRGVSTGTSLPITTDWDTHLSQFHTPWEAGHTLLSFNLGRVGLGVG